MYLFFSSFCLLWPSRLLRRLAVTSLNFIEIGPGYLNKTERSEFMNTDESKQNVNNLPCLTQK